MQDYQKQATDFLAKHKIAFSYKLANKKLPTWEESGIRKNNHFVVALKRNGAKVSFDFFGSKNDFQKGVHELDSYSVLVCLSSDLYVPEDFESFCSEFGYDAGDKKTKKLFKVCLKQSQKLQKFFDTEEMREDLQNIQ